MRSRRRGGEPGHDFIRDIIAADLAAGRCTGVVTRFPPEPNGYLHIGHAKAICLNFGVAQEFGGRCHLRFDDTNPTREAQEYIDAIERDLRWLGVDWGSHLHHASDYFEQLYGWAEHLIGAGLAYVDDQPAEAMRAARGTLTEPGRDSPFRGRSPAENLDLFRRMRSGEFPNGARVLRARIDMASGNINLRDPVLYRILHAAHPRTGTQWCIYPTYDFAHGQSDAIEGITHSLCTLEFEDHRPLYDWLIEHLPIQELVGSSRPRQYEFARLNLAYTVLSKRFLTGLVEAGHVAGWDDPRMPTLAGLRRRGVPAQAIHEFVRRIGVARANSLVDVAMFEHAVREVLNRSAPRRLAVLRPLKLTIENYPEGRSEELEAVNNPEDPGAGTRQIPFGRELYIERDDFLEDPPKNFYRLGPGREVRLRYAYFVTCREVVKDAAGRGRSNCAAPMIRRRAAAMPPMGARCAARSTGCRLPTPRRPRSGSTTRSSPGPIRERRATSWPISTRIRSKYWRGPWSSPGSPATIHRRPCSSSARAISFATPIPRRAASSSTARSGCATPGPERRQGAEMSGYDAALRLMSHQCCRLES